MVKMTAMLTVIISIGVMVIMVMMVITVSEMMVETDMR